ncbi:hypothetical protein EMCG_07521 [[Emmonsia] crescens]|uniref:Uncharacterized protein n=1 Tax=[Emmonsia] crescens TaxID=73230 RepID=A0A0G2I8F2_9EURO|nr:hypothetical protein EMCG_07521 [Emmonsia crescens UAMH 3008]
MTFPGTSKRPSSEQLPAPANLSHSPTPTNPSAAHQDLAPALLLPLPPPPASPAVAQTAPPADTPSMASPASRHSVTSNGMPPP